MTLAVIASRALAGLDAPPVRVEVHLAAVLPVFNIVGLPDAGVRESRERVRAAIVNSGFDFLQGVHASFEQTARIIKLQVDGQSYTREGMVTVA